jgi:anthranilate phosphoribosyltransferase
MQPVLQHLLAGQNLSREEADRAFEIILTGGANEMQVAAMLALLAVKGVTLDELVAGASAMRRHVTRLPVTDDPRAPILDTCGTGGAPKTFNISTAAAIVAAAARPPAGSPVERVRVAKHGGRSRTGRGSAEVLALLGVNIDASADVQARCLDEAGVCFSFAVNHHPAMKFAAGPRKSLGFPTVFNLLGPLTNPAGARRQLLGVWDGKYAPLMAQALLELGCDSAMVVHGLDSLDEITTCDQTFIARVRAGKVETRTFDPLAAGVPRAAGGSFAVETPEASASLIRRIIENDRSPDIAPARDIVKLNAAAALMVAGMTDKWEAALTIAEDAIASGTATRTLHDLARLSACR